MPPPATAPHTPRAAALRFAIVGAGMSGLLAALQLQRAGYQHITVYEKADRIGGTWRDNTYPGVACDVPAHSYTYSFAPYAEWSRYMAEGAQIQQYFEHIVAQYALAPLIALRSEVTGCVWQHGAWQLQLADGRHAQADVVIAAVGVLHHPSVPALPGLDSFAGACFHSAQWQHDVPLDGQRVGVIGTGSTGAQIVSALAGRAQTLLHFQRTPQWILPADNPHYTEADKQALRTNPAQLHALRHSEVYQAITDSFAQAVIAPDSPQMAQLEAAVLAHLDNSVADPALRARLRPQYRAACKRLVISSDYYRAIQHPQVQLVDAGIAAIEPDGVRTRDGVLHALDVLVLATGFDAERFARDLHVVGLDGVQLNDVWAVRPHAYLAMAVAGFPNFFMLNGPSGPVGNFSLIDVAEAQWHYIAQLIERIAHGDCDALSVTPQAMAAFEQARIAAARQTIWATGCKSWYLDREGIPSSWPWSYAHFQERLAQPDWAHWQRHHHAPSATVAPTPQGIST